MKYKDAIERLADAREYAPDECPDECLAVIRGALDDAEESLIE